MNDPKQQELIEIYKLHAELADRVSQRREGANRIYVGLLVSFTMLIVAFIRFDVVDFSSIILYIVGAIGALLSISWYIVIRSYRQLNAGKFKALHELEKKLAFSFFTREWELLTAGERFRRYWRLSVVETFLPAMFFVVFVVLMAFAWNQ